MQMVGGSTGMGVTQEGTIKFAPLNTKSCVHNSMGWSALWTVLQHSNHLAPKNPYHHRPMRWTSKLHAGLATNICKSTPAISDQHLHMESLEVLQPHEEPNHVKEMQSTCANKRNTRTLRQHHKKKHWVCELPKELLTASVGELHCSVCWKEIGLRSP